MIAFCALGAGLSGCNRLDVNSARVRGIAYVRMDDVVKHDPLYPQLSRIDDAIAMVTLANAGPRVPHSAAEIARESADLQAQLAAAKTRTQQIVDAKRRQYGDRERAAVVAALAAAGVPNPQSAAASLGEVSAAQVRSAQMQAGRDFNAYQHSVVQQSNAAASAIVHQLQREANEKLQAKAMQEQQQETNLSLHLSQNDASERLSIQTRLSMLALDPATRRSLQAQLAAMQRRDDAAVAAQRAADRRAFAAYQAQVTAETNAAIRAQLANINSQTRAKILSQQNAVGAQLRSSLGVAPSPAHVSPATQAEIRRIAAQFQSQYQQDVQDVVTQYAETTDALEAQYAMLHGADATAAGATQQEVSLLQQQRQALYGQIVARIEREARRLGQQKGFRVVFSDVTAAAGGYDMTNDLIADIESEHE